MVMRYGHQQLSEIESWPLQRLYSIANALQKRVRAEGEAGRQSGED